jgi:hypothetical protein
MNQPLIQTPQNKRQNIQRERKGGRAARGLPLPIMFFNNDNKVFENFDRLAEMQLCEKYKEKFDVSSEGPSFKTAITMVF